MKNRLTVDMPAFYDQSEWTFGIYLWTPQSGYEFSLLHRYDLPEEDMEVLEPGISRYSEDTFLDKYSKLFGNLKSFVKK